MATQLNTWSLVIKTIIYTTILFLSSNLAYADGGDYSLIGIENLVDYANEQVSEVNDINPKDPFEKLNRKIFKFNDKVDKAILKPVVKGYRKVIPSAIRKGIRNVFSHIDDLFVIGNDVLQAKPKQTLEDISRFAFNSTFGIFGIFDVASHMGLPKHDEDFGQTMGKWGLKSGPYLMMPLLGPGTVRSFTGDVAHYVAGNNVTMDNDHVLNPAKNLSSSAIRNATLAIEVIDKRESFVGAEEVLDSFVIDRYSAIRDAYLQNREYLTKDGEVAETDEINDGIADEEDLVDDKIQITKNTEQNKKSLPKPKPKKANISLDDIIEDDEDLAE